MMEADAVTQAEDESGAPGRGELAAALAAADTGADEELVAAALKLLELTTPEGIHAGKYRSSKC